MSERGRAGHWALGLACALLMLAGCSREATDWKQASTANSIEAYQLYLQHYPHGGQAAQAQARLQQLSEQRDWQIATAGNTRDAYQQFLTQHPNGQWAEEARLRIENFAQAAESAEAAPAGAIPPAVTPGAASESSTTSSAAGVAPAKHVATTASNAAHSEPRARGEHARLVASRAHPATHATAARTSGRTVQLGAFRTRAGAELEWRQLAARFATLRSLHPHYLAVRSHSGRLYRLQVHLSSAAAATGLCATLKRHARACVRVNA